MKKAVATLLAHTEVTIYPHTTSSRNPICTEKEFPIDAATMGKYIFDSGKESRNGRQYYKGSFICEMESSVTQLKRQGLIDDLRKRGIIPVYMIAEKLDSFSESTQSTVHATR